MNTVAVKRNGNSKLTHYHTKVCHYLERAKSYRWVDRSILPGDLEHCPACKGDYTPYSGGPNKYTCGSCGDTLRGDGSCPFCEKWDEVMA